LTIKVNNLNKLIAVTGPEIFSTRHSGQGENEQGWSRLFGRVMLAFQEYDFDFGSGFAREIAQLNVNDQ
jgi:hypothetical protein